MVIACDTSFLFSLYGNDVHSPKAVAWTAQNTRALYLNSLTHFEFGNAIRFSEFRKAIPLGAAARYWAGFEAAIAQGATHIRVGSAIFGARDYAARQTG